MKRLLLILIPFLLYSCSYQSSRGPADWIYVAQAGSDVTGDGSSGNPFATVSHAATTASPGDTIYVVAGTITETAQTVLPVGVSIYGAGATSIITTSAALNPMILVSSASQGTNGNQNISNVYFDGNDTTAIKAIGVVCRSNVKVHNCYFYDFYQYGVTFQGITSGSGAPTTYSTGNEFTDNVMVNCGRDTWTGSYYLAYSALSIGGQDGMLVDGNYIDCVTGGRYCYGIKPNNEGYNKNNVITNNTILINWRHVSTSYDFAIECWNETGVLIAYNYLNGSIDLGGYWSAKVGNNSYGAWVHHNVIGPNVLAAAGGSPRGILIEADAWNVVIEKNYIKNVLQGIYMNPMTSAGDISVNGRNYHVFDNIRISCNIIYNIGTTDTNYTGWGIQAEGDGTYTHTMSNIFILNNVLIGDTDASSTMDGIIFFNVGTITDLRIRNNIIENFDYAFFYAGLGDISQTIDTLSIENNCAYGNGYSNLPRYGTGMTPTHNTTQNNITTNPLFRTGNYRLQSGSPCKDTGINVSLTSDYAGHAVPQNTTPDMGAYEYGDYLVQLPSGNLLRNASGKLMYIH